MQVPWTRQVAAAWQEETGYRQTVEVAPTAPVDRPGPGCGREQGLQGKVSGQSTWVGERVFPELGMTRRGAYL